MWKHLYHIWYNITAACICKRLYWRKQQYKWQQNNNKYGNNQEILVSASLWLALYRKQALKEGTKNAPKAKLPMYKVGLQNCCKNITWTILQNWKKTQMWHRQKWIQKFKWFSQHLGSHHPKMQQKIQKLSHNTFGARLPKNNTKYKKCRPQKIWRPQHLRSHGCCCSLPVCVRKERFSVPRRIYTRPHKC